MIISLTAKSRIANSPRPTAFSPITFSTLEARISQSPLVTVANPFQTCWSAISGTEPSMRSCCTGSSPTITTAFCAKLSRRRCVGGARLSLSFPGLLSPPPLGRGASSSCRSAFGWGEARGFDGGAGAAARDTPPRELLETRATPPPPLTPPPPPPRARFGAVPLLPAASSAALAVEPVCRAAELVRPFCLARLPPPPPLRPLLPPVQTLDAELPTAPVAALLPLLTAGARAAAAGGGLWVAPFSDVRNGAPPPPAPCAAFGCSGSSSPGTSATGFLRSRLLQTRLSWLTLMKLCVIMATQTAPARGRPPGPRRDAQLDDWQTTAKAQASVTNTAKLNYLPP